MEGMDSNYNEDKITDLGSAHAIQVIKKNFPYNQIAKFFCEPMKSRVKLSYNWESYGDYAFYTNMVLKEDESGQILT